MSTRKWGLLTVACAVALTGGVIAGPVAAAAPAEGCTSTDIPADSAYHAHRIAGPDRYGTSVCASSETWLDHGLPNTPVKHAALAAVLARGDIYPDALAGTPLAAQVGGPLLLTAPTALRPEVAAELQRVLVPGATVYLLGSTGSLSQGVEDAVQALGFVPNRIAGADRYETAVKIADAMPRTNNFFFTTGLDFPDALVAGRAAAAENGPGNPEFPSVFAPYAVLFTKGATMVPVTAAFAQSRPPGFWNTVGAAADQAVVANFGADRLWHRYVGRDRYETASLLAYSLQGHASAGLADGTTFPDALTGSEFMAEHHGPLLLTKPRSLPAATASYLRSQVGKPTDVVIDVFGGPSSVQDGVARAAVAAITPAS